MCEVPSRRAVGGYPRDVAYVLVLLLALAAGAAVGVATLRTGERVPDARRGTWTRAYEPASPEAASSVEGVPRSVEQAGVREPLPTDPTMQSRIIGVLGLIVVCLVAAGAIVGSLYVAFLAAKGLFGG
jgi:hypothetical protein